MIGDDLWARLVYDLAAAYHHRVSERDALVRATLPLYMGRVASFVLEMADADASCVEDADRGVVHDVRAREGLSASAVGVTVRAHRAPTVARHSGASRIGEEDMWQVVQQVLAQAWQQFATQSLALLPNVLASLLFLAIGVVLAVVAGRVAKFLLRRSAVERKATRLGLTSWLERAGILSATAVVVRLVQVVFAMMTAALVLYSLDAALASDLTRRFFLYIPNLVVGVAIFFIGILAARVVSRSVLIGAVNRGVGAAKLLAAAGAGRHRAAVERRRARPRRHRARNRTSGAADPAGRGDARAGAGRRTREPRRGRALD